MTDPAGGHPATIYDAEMIAQIRSAYTQAEGDERWSIRLTLGEIAALLRAVDARDDALRRLVGEWEGDVPEPLPAVQVVDYDPADELAPLPTPTVCNCGQLSAPHSPGCALTTVAYVADDPQYQPAYIEPHLFTLNGYAETIAAETIAAETIAAATPFVVEIKGTVEETFPYECRRYPGIRHTAPSAKTCCRQDLEGADESEPKPYTCKHHPACRWGGHSVSCRAANA